VPHGRSGFSGIEPVDGEFYGAINTIFSRAYNDNESVQFYSNAVFNTGKYLLKSNTIPEPDNPYSATGCILMLQAALLRLQRMPAR
jgi:hypothetical protein